MNYLEILNQKIINKEKLTPLLTYWRLKNHRIVFTNGCFDILHRGHIEYLAKAASLGDVLVIGLNTDQSVKNIKGPKRPVQDEKSRALVLASLTFVTAVVFFNEDTPYNLIEQIKPDVLVKGADYQKKDIVGADVVESNGGEIITVNLTEGYSTSSVINKIKE
jgi:rfaE bifunctional protein nucleotidyltransferase chain/domain